MTLEEAIKELVRLVDELANVVKRQSDHIHELTLRVNELELERGKWQLQLIRQETRRPGT